MIPIADAVETAESSDELPSALAMFFQDTQGSVVLDRVEERWLLYQIQLDASDGLEAIAAAKHLAFSNLRLVIKNVVSFFKIYEPHRSKPESLFLDCVMAGIEGVYTAARKFDLMRNTKFSTYVVWWIKHHIRTELVFDRQAVQPIRVLTDMSTVTTKIVHHEAIPDFENTWVAKDATVPEESLETIELKDRLRYFLRYSRKISVKQRKILVEHYGLKGAPPKTYKALAMKMGLTTERVRQLEIEALRVAYQELSAGAFDKLDREFNDIGCLI